MAAYLFAATRDDIEKRLTFPASINVLVMLKLAVVGDLSQCDPAGLAKALDAALAAADIVVQVGDINPGYDVLKQRLSSGKLFPIPGNHDTLGPGNWDAELPDQPKQWQKSIGGIYMIGLDNTKDVIDQEGWSLLNGYVSAQPPSLPLFLFCHKPLSPIVLPDGTESTHIMGEGAFPNADAEKLKHFLAPLDATLCHGHYHGWTMMKPSYGTVIVDGRGGAAPQIGYTLFFIDPEGWAAHSITL